MFRQATGVSSLFTTSTTLASKHGLCKVGRPPLRHSAEYVGFILPVITVSILLATMNGHQEHKKEMRILTLIHNIFDPDEVCKSISSVH